MITWDDTADRDFTTGVGHGVLYSAYIATDLPIQSGVAWNGLISVEDDHEGGDLTSVYSDGQKYTNILQSRTYKSHPTAFSYPKEFMPYIGEKYMVQGVIATGQPVDRYGFDLSYRVKDSDSYKIHMIYNAYAVPTTLRYSTVSDSTEPSRYEWDIFPVPPTPRPSGFRPTSHFVIDPSKTDPEIMQKVNDSMYGKADGTPPNRYPVENLLKLFLTGDPNDN